MDEIRNAILSARAEQVNLIQKSIVNAEEVLENDEDVRKAEDAENVDDEEDSEKEKEDDNNDGEEDAKDDDDPDGGDADIEEGCGGKVKKSDIAEALSGHNGLKIKKKGKEIKEHLTNVLIPELNAKLAEKEALANRLLESCGDAPTREPDCWWTDGIKMDCGYKVYDWREMECCNNDGRVMYETLSASDAKEKRGNVPESEDQAVSRRDYNEAVRAICNIKVDLKTCEIMQNLKDSEEYELNPRQVLALKF